MSSSALGSVLLALVVLAPAAGALAAALGGRAARRGVIAGSGLAALASLGLLAVVATTGPVALLDGAALHAGRIQAVLLPVITGVGLLVTAFAGRYLTGDPRQRRFFVLAGLTIGATAAMVTAATFTGLAITWVAAGAGLAALVAHDRRLPAARAATRRIVRAFAIGDTAVLAALGLILATGGDVRLDDPTAAAATLAARDVAGVSVAALVAGLLVLAALVRSAQVPFSGWLAGTVAAPTPVSALLHAGVVNGGGILLVLLSPVLVTEPAAVAVAFAAGAVTALAGTARMVARSDVKGALAQSTASQMGFMLLQVGLGALSAAVFHIAAHAMWKASRFLGSGSAIQARERARHAPATAAGGRPLADGLLAGTTALALVAGATALIAPAIASRPGGAVLLAFAWLTTAQAAFAWLQRRPGGAADVAGGLALLALPVGAYVALLGALETFLAPALPAAAAGAWVPGWLVLPVLALAGAALALRWAAALRGPAGARPSAVHLTLYAAARRAGDAPTAIERSL